LAGGVGAAIKASGINPAGAANNLPEWKFVLGLAGSGQSNNDMAVLDPYGSTPKPGTRELAREMVERNIRQLPRTWGLVIKRQLIRLWTQNDTAIWAFNPLVADRHAYAIPDRETTPLAHYWVMGERGFFVPVVFWAGFGVVLLGRDRRWKYGATFLVCFVAIYSLTHLTIEAQTRYRYLAMPAIYTLAAPSWFWLTGERRRSRLFANQANNAAITNK
jgi:hypothetical protein